MADPRISVIVVCLNSSNVREVCLNALQSQADLGSNEILAVGHWGEVNSESMLWGERFPAVCWLSVSDETTIPEMRTCGILQSRGEIVALLEDDCVISEGWLLAVMRAHAESYPIIGGAIAPGNYRRFLDWAVYFCEYARFAPPFSGPQNALPGNHVTYKKNALPPFEAGEGFYEVFFHNDWQRSGGQLIADPNIVVSNINHWSLRHITNIPFHHGRAFAGMRSQSFPFWRKVVYAVLSLALPILKAARLAAAVFDRKQYQLQFFLSLPWIMIFLVSWSLGELLGYVAGTGHSAKQWR